MKNNSTFSPDTGLRRRVALFILWLSAIVTVGGVMAAIILAFGWLALPAIVFIGAIVWALDAVFPDAGIDL